MRKLFVAALSVVVIGLSACGGSDDPAKSTECKITKFVTSDGKNWTITETSATVGTVTALYDKTSQASNLTVTTLEISSKASITPNNATTAKDYSQAVTYTVTAEDGKTSRVYTVQAQKTTP